MRKVFADSLYWIALSIARDQWHFNALNVSRSLRNVEIVTTDEVLGEFLTALRYTTRLRQIASLQTVAVLENPAITVIPQCRRGFEAGFLLYQGRQDKAYSLVDRISMETMRRERILEILTHDVHFIQEGFKILL